MFFFSSAKWMAANRTEYKKKLNELMLQFYHPWVVDVKKKKKKNEMEESIFYSFYFIIRMRWVLTWTCDILRIYSSNDVRRCGGWVKENAKRMTRGKKLNRRSTRSGSKMFQLNWAQHLEFCIKSCDLFGCEQQIKILLFFHSKTLTWHIAVICDNQ